MDKQELQTAADLTRDLMICRTPIELEYEIDGADDLLRRHWLLLMLIEIGEDNDILSRSFGSKPLRLAKHSGE